MEDNQPQQDAPDVPNEAVETPEQPVEETTEVETPQEEVKDQVEEEDDFLPQYNETQEFPDFDFSNLPTDENGLVDLNAYAEAMKQRDMGLIEQARAAARQEFNEQRQEERAWSKAVNKYPQLKENRELRDLIHMTRMGHIVDGKNPTPLQIADQLFKHLGTAKTEGYQQAKTTETIQKSASLETASQPANNETKKEQLFKKISDPHDRTGAEAAQRDLLKLMLFGN